MATMTERITIPELPELTFEDGPHIYRVNGLIVPSVSTIIKPLSDSKYSGIRDRTLEKAARKGTSVHNAIENWIKYGIEDIPSDHIGYFDGFMRWFDKAKPEIVGSEIRLYHKIKMYAGTIDNLSYIDGLLTLIDYKTTATISDMLCGVQLEAYAHMLDCFGIKVQRKQILHLKKDGKFDVREYPAQDALRWLTFGSLKNVYDYIESYR